MRPKMRLLAVAVIATVGLHFAWEMLQAPAFAPFADSVWAGTRRCFQAALGDLVIAAGAYAATALLCRRPGWALADRWLAPAVVWLLAGEAVTVAFELYALATDRWAYGPGMPTVLGIGLWPLLQWIVVPLLTLLLVRRAARGGARPPAP